MHHQMCMKPCSAKFESEAKSETKKRTTYTISDEGRWRSIKIVTNFGTMIAREHLPLSKFRSIDSHRTSSPSWSVRFQTMSAPPHIFSTFEHEDWPKVEGSMDVFLLCWSGTSMRAVNGDDDWSVDDMKRKQIISLFQEGAPKHRTISKERSCRSNDFLEKSVAKKNVEPATPCLLLWNMWSDGCLASDEFWNYFVMMIDYDSCAK